jgi:cellulose synthase (UDP-forming)
LFRFLLGSLGSGLQIPGPALNAGPRAADASLTPSDRTLAREASSAVSERAGIWLLRCLVACGGAALVFYFGWWFQEGRITSPVLATALALAALYHCFQMGGAWFFYLMARRRPPVPARPAGLAVDVFVTACREEPELVRRALAAALALRGEHETWLLDDGNDPRLAELAGRLGARYLTRSDRRNAKAGNLNAALARTRADVVAIFDVDHVPVPEFLERTVGHFADPRVGFVQVMLTYGNGGASWISRAAVEAWLDFHNPTSIGMDGIGAVTMHGSNALIRRAALESIGGYRPGLAEDLATSIELHAAGWRSVYVAEPLAPGLAPVDVAGWFTQQLKWSRGVFEVLLTQYPRLFRRLGWPQRLSYAVRSTYYWIGSLIFAHLVFLCAALFSGRPMVRSDVEEYLLHYLPLAVMFFAIRRVARRLWRHPATPTALEWRGILLVYATWPAYTLAWLMACLRAPLRFRLTPKRASDPQRLWLVPQALFAVLLSAGAIYALVVGGERQTLLIASALGQVLMATGFFAFAAPARRRLGGAGGEAGAAPPDAELGAAEDAAPAAVRTLFRSPRWQNPWPL